MATQELTEVWKSAVRPLKDRYIGTACTKFLEMAELLTLSTDEMIVAVENIPARQFIQKYVQSELLDTISKETGITPTKVSFSVRSQKKSDRRPAVQALEMPSLFTSAGGSTRNELTANPYIAANLNPKYTLDKFIVGAKNRLAFAAAQAVASSPGTSYNPLYIYGGVGLGKTHILQAIGNEIIMIRPETKVIYVSCENFLNEFVASIQKRTPDQFKKKYRTIDVFLIDDIQFIAGRDGIQEEFFHTFNALHQADKQIVMTSDKVPSDIKGLEERLASRFSMGMIADIQLPDQATRQAILAEKCLEKGVTLSEDVLSYISEHVETNIRELEGVLTRVIADLMTHGSDPTISTVRAALHSVLSQEKTVRKNSAQLLTEVVCRQYGLEREDIVGACRKRELVRPRQILMYLLKHEAGMTYPTIGREIGGRDHTTVMYGVEKITKELKKDDELLEELQLIKDRFYEVK